VVAMAPMGALMPIWHCTSIK